MKNNLLIKAEKNIKTGAWAEENGFFDVAVSRFYYALYQKILYILKTKYDFDDTALTEDSHNTTLNTFIRKIMVKLADDEKVWINILGKIKRCRVYADYKEDIISDKNDYNLMFKINYNNISGVVEKFIPKE
jgi:uncharacterized protein (UPF0332 family)